MRNLKRALSLTLASVMLLGMMIVGSSAASFNDADDIENVTAATILQELKIMQGSNGNFAPDQTVTRGQMAIIICKMLYGDKLTVSQFADTQQFDDVPANQYYTGYVNLAANLGIISGYGNGNFGPGDPVTTAQAALMLTRALGYYQNDELKGQGWANNALTAMTMATRLDIFHGLNLGVNDPLSRDNVSAMTFNTLTRATPVKFNPILGEYYTDGQGVTSGVDYIDAYEFGTQQNFTLGWTVYGLYISNTHDTDDFNRPSDEWSYEAGGIIGSFADEPVKVFTSKVTSKALYDAIGKTAVDSYDTFNVSINGDPVGTVNGDGDFVPGYTRAQLNANKNDTNKDFYEKAGGAEIKTNGNNVTKLTGNGVITEVYVDGTDKDNRRIDVVIYDVYAAEVYDVKSDGKITLSDLDAGPAQRTDEFEAEGFAEDDVVAYTYANKKIQSVAPAEKLEGKVTRVSANTGDSSGNNFKVEGSDTAYKYNRSVQTGTLKTDSVNNNVLAYLDSNGYVIYIDESAVTYDYAYLLSANSETDRWGGDSVVYARLVLTDGTMIKVTTDNDADDLLNDDGGGVYTDDVKNMIVSYSVDKNDVYTLTKKDADTTTTKGTGGLVGGYSTNFDIFKNGRTTFAMPGSGSYTANSDTIVIVADEDVAKPDNSSFTIYTGVKNIPDITAKAGNATKIDVAATDKGIAKVVYIKDADVSGTNSVIYIRANSGADVAKEVGGYKCFELDAYVDGKAETLLVKEDSNADKKLVKQNFGGVPGIYGESVQLDTGKYIVAAKSLTKNGDGVVTDVRFFDSVAAGKGVFTGTSTDKDNSTSRDTVTLGGSAYGYVSGVAMMRWSTDDKFVDSRITTVKKDGNDEFLAVVDDYSLIGLCVVEHEGSGSVSLGSGASADEIQSGLNDLAANGGTATVTSPDLSQVGGHNVSVPSGATLVIGGDIASTKGGTIEGSGNVEIGDGTISGAVTTSTTGNVTLNGTTVNAAVNLTGADNATLNGVTVNASKTVEVDDVTLSGDVELKANAILTINGEATLADGATITAAANAQIVVGAGANVDALAGIPGIKFYDAAGNEIVITPTPSGAVGRVAEPEEGTVTVTTLPEGTYTWQVVPGTEGDHAVMGWVFEDELGGGDEETIYTVSFDLNGGTGTAPTDIDQSAEGAAITLPTTTATKAGYTFAGWGTAASSTTANAGAAEASYTPSADVTLYAVWTANTVGGTLSIDSAYELSEAAFTGKKGGETIVVTVTKADDSAFANETIAITGVTGWQVSPTDAGTETSVSVTITLPAQANIVESVTDAAVTITVTAN